jgi:translation initiation factor 2 alpha subunit (eIF-2alpha)
MNFQVDDVVLCTVKKIEGTTVFLEMEDGSPGTMMLSEVAAGRIRNLRQYVSPNRKIVCKILKSNRDHFELSLRRVTTKERESVLEEIKKEKALTNMLKVAGEEPEKVIEKIKEHNSIVDFIEEAREDVKVLEKYLNKVNAEKVFKILAEKEGREKVVEKRISLKSDGESGVNDIREILDVDAEVHYLGSSKFSVSVKGKDFRGANEKMEEVLEEIEKRAEKKGAVFSLGK